MGALIPNSPSNTISLIDFSLLPFIITITVYTDMIFIVLVAYAVLAFITTAIICVIIGSFNIITDEKEQKTVFYIILILVFLLFVSGGVNDTPMPHMFKA